MVNEHISTILDKVELRFELENGQKISITNPKPSRAIDNAIFHKVKRALVLKSQHMFYRTNGQIADRFKVSATTVSIIGKSESLHQYLMLRKRNNKS